MTDRELLEAAAKAAGIEIDKSTTNGGGRGNTGFDMQGNAMLDWHECIRWNPLTDDGDALRLFTKLPFRNLYVSEIGVTVFLPNKEGEIGLKCDEYADEHNGDLSAATRRAIVRAAAEIGEKL